MILDGVFEPGDRLIEERLVAQLNVSRTPIREALRKLEEEKLVTTSPIQGVRVTPITYDIAREHYLLREVLDGLAAALACFNITDQQISDLNDLLGVMREIVDDWRVEKWIEVNSDFHLIISHTAKSPLVSSVLDRTIHITARLFFPTIEFDVARARAALHEHEMIVLALSARDMERAEAIARHHIRNARNALAASSPLHLVGGD